jgi:hypothetical protein
MLATRGSDGLRGAVGGAGRLLDIANGLVGERRILDCKTTWPGGSQRANAPHRLSPFAFYKYFLVSDRGVFVRKFMFRY